MYIVSSRLTYFHTKIYQWILLILLFIGILLYFIFGLPNTFLFVLIYAFSIFYLPWYFIGRKYKVVYLGKNFFKVDETIIPFNSIESIDKHLISPSYTVCYKINNQNKKFSFLPKYYFPLLTPYYIKEIKKLIKNKKANNV